MASRASGCETAAALEAWTSAASRLLPDGQGGGMVTAHQGGLDELALVAVPLAVVALLLWLAGPDRP
jgi:hypothetical protein